MKVVNMLATYNEKDNVGPMVEALEEIAKKCPKDEFVNVFVDSHSPDGTGEVVKEIGKKKRTFYCSKHLAV